jgi:hypothetical protein
MFRAWTVSVALAATMAILHACPAVAQPQVTPDRIDDVPDGIGSPFPRFDDFSWRAFIALNWPAMPGAANRGQPDRTKKFSDLGPPRVWESWKARYEVFVPGARRPEAWASFDGLNPCGGIGNEVKILSAFSHFHDFNQAAFTLARLANPLIAQNRTHTRYEVRFNREQFDTIVDNEWYIKKKLPTKDNPGTFNDGSIEIKAAWRILIAADKEDVRKRFYVAKDALVFDPGETAKAGTVVCLKRDIALVGFHIVTKTKLRPQWIWSSFEHVDNVPPVGSGNDREPDAKDVPAPYSYHSGRPPQELVPRNAPDAVNAANFNPNPDPMQVIRQRSIHPETMRMNRDYWALPEIKGSVWANYMLVMTQWPSAPGVPSPTNDGSPFPRSVPATRTNTANTTMETYQQRPQSSCMACHDFVSNQKGMDFVAFMALDATDPAQATIARSVVPAGRTIGIEPASRARRIAPLRTPLDDDPSVAALAKMLRGYSAR